MAMRSKTDNTTGGDGGSEDERRSTTTSATVGRIVSDDDDRNKRTAASSPSSSVIESLSPFGTLKSNHVAGEHKKKFKELLQKYAGITDHSSLSDEKRKLYDPETDLMQTILAGERTSILCGVAGGILAVASIRYAPTYFVKRYGGQQKADALRAADKAWREGKFGFFHYVTVWGLQLGFGTWVGRWTYSASSRGRDDMFANMAKVPLVEGRSIISEKVCGDWIGAYRTIPKEFWSEGEEEEYWGEPKAWRAIKSFSENCLKREAYERSMLQRRTDGGRGDDDETGEGKEPPSIPSPGVPPDFPYES